MHIAFLSILFTQEGGAGAQLHMFVLCNLFSMALHNPALRRRGGSLQWGRPAGR